MLVELEIQHEKSKKFHNKETDAVWDQASAKQFSCVSLEWTDCNFAHPCSSSALLRTQKLLNSDCITSLLPLHNRFKTTLTLFEPQLSQ